LGLEASAISDPIDIMLHIPSKDPGSEAGQEGEEIVYRRSNERKRI